MSAPKLWNGLTSKEEDFARKIAHQILAGETVNYGRAYRLTYACANSSDATIHKRASELGNKPAIQARMQEILANETAYQRVTERDIFGRIMRIADDDQARNADKLRALELAGKSRGMFAEVQKPDEPNMTPEEAQERLDRALAKLREFDAQKGKIIPLTALDANRPAR